MISRRTELPRLFSDGFVLTKNELEGIHALLVRQMEGIGTPKNQYKTSYEIRFQYGPIQERRDLQEILNETNGDQLAIKGLKISMEDQNNSQDRAILLQFSNIKNLPSPVSISYTITGTDPRWVDDTDTQLATKLKGCKTISLDKWARSFKSGGIVIFLLIYIILYFLFYAGVPYLYINTQILLIPLDLVGVFLVVLLLIIYLGQFFFPSYNFCWGVYEHNYKIRTAIGKWLLIGCLAAILISIIANFFSVKIGIH